MTLKTTPHVSAENQRYEGVDFRKENHYRVPQYDLTRNLIPNGGFEQNLKYWQFGARSGKITQEPPQGGYYHIDTQNASQGKRSLKILIRKNQMPMCPATFGIPVETNGTYTVSFYAKTDLPGIRMQTASTTAIWPKFINWGYARLTSQWKRYQFTKKAINGALHIGFLPLNPSEDGHIWVDAVQLEKSDSATEYTQPKILATLLTSKRDNFFEPNDKINARIRINGPASQSINLSVKLSDFQDIVLEKWQKTIQLDHQGEAFVALKKAQFLPTGFYRIETIVTGKDGIAMRDYDRLTVMPFVKADHRHKQLFAVGATSNNRGDWKRRFERWQNIGVGSAIYNGFSAQAPSYLKMHKEYGVFAFGSIFIKGYKAGDLDLRATENEILNDEQLKQVEEHAYQTALAYPWQNTWKLVNEPHTSKQNMKAFVKMLVFAKRGILRANPKARISSPDPANMYLSSGIQWTEQFIQAGGLEVCDIIAIHPYRPTPESPSLDRDTATMLKMLDKNNYQGEVWFTEGVYHQNRMLPSYQLDVYKGCSTDHWRVGAFSYDLGLGEKMCFAYTMRSFLAALKHGDRVKMLVDWGLNKNSYMDLDMTPTATSFAPNTLTRLLGDADYRQTVALGMDLHCEVFEDDEQRPVAALWSSMYDVDRLRASGPTLDLSGLPPGTQIYNAMGRELDKIPTTMELSPFPFFLRGNRGTLDELVSSLNHATIQGKQFQSILASFRLKNATQASITLKNIRSKPFKGHVILKDQTQARSKPLTKSLSLEAQGSWEQQVFLDWPKKGILPIDYAVKVVSDQGVSLLQHQIKMEVIRVPRLKTQPRIDGDLSDWPAKIEMPLPNRFKDFKTSPTRDKVQRTMIPRQGDKDLSATLFAGWHPSGLYLAVKVRDDDHTPVADLKRFWIFDCLQLYFDGWFDAREHPNAGFDHNDQALDILPLPNGTVRVNRSVAPEQQLGFLKTGLNTKIKASFKHTQKGYSIYEVFIPVEQLVAEKLQSGESFGFALLINDNDHDFRKRGLTLTPSGTEPFMHPELYPLMILE